MRIVTVFLLFALGVADAVSAESPDSPALQRWDRVVCIESRDTNDPKTGKLCSAFLVHADKRLFLVTSGHSSAETNRNSRLIFRDRSGQSRGAAFTALFVGESNPWTRDKVSDFAVAQLEPEENGRTHFELLMAISIPLENVSTASLSRTTRIEAVGFPLALGAKSPVSPVVVVGHVASDEIDSKNDWGVEPIVYCSPPLAQGTSGGPAFIGDESTENATVVGMYVGIVRDVSGAKLSKMVPSRLIHAAISDRVDSSVLSE